MNRAVGEAGWMAGVAPVERPVAAARATYDRVPPLHDLAETPSEHQARSRGRRLLPARPGERVLEIGPGTGHALAALARSVGPAGRVTGVDLSARMLGRSRRRAARAGYTGRIALVQGDAHRLPLRAGVFDAVFMSFVLELIDTPQIPPLLDECRRGKPPSRGPALVFTPTPRPPPGQKRPVTPATRGPPPPRVKRRDPAPTEIQPPT